MTATKVEAVRKTKGKGKQPKVFVEDKGIALELAQTIADKQEDKSKERADKRHVQVAAHRPSQKPRASSKTKLKEVKTALKAEKARVKKEKAKARKQKHKESSTEGPDTNQSQGGSSASEKRTRKRVSFI